MQSKGNPLDASQQIRCTICGEAIAMTGWHCLRCGTHNVETALLCPACESGLPQTYPLVPCRVCGAPLDATSWHCMRCETHNNPIHHECDRCGTSIHESCGIFEPVIILPTTEFLSEYRNLPWTVTVVARIEDFHYVAESRAREQAEAADEDTTDKELP